MKIFVSSLKTTNELQILRHISAIDAMHSAQHIARLLDSFELHGPNGIHNCLVFELMGPTVNTMIEELPQFKPRKYGMKVRYPPNMAKRILRQSLRAIKFLHDKKIAHGDIQPGNILFAGSDISSTTESLLRHDTKNISHQVERIDGKQDRWAPRYLCVAQSLVPPLLIQSTDNFELKLSDLGAG